MNISDFANIYSWTIGAVFTIIGVTWKAINFTNRRMLLHEESLFRRDLENATDEEHSLIIMALADLGEKKDSNSRNRILYTMFILSGVSMLALNLFFIIKYFLNN